MSPHAGGQGGTLGHKPIGLGLQRNSMSKCNPLAPWDRGHWGKVAMQVARQWCSLLVRPWDTKGRVHASQSPGPQWGPCLEDPAPTCLLRRLLPWSSLYRP